jgi:hypothetical protein
MQRIKAVLVTLLALPSYTLFAQETITAQREILNNKIRIGKESDEIQYQSDAENFYTPGSPFIDKEGKIYLYKTLGIKSVLEISKDSVVAKEYKGNLIGYRELGNRNFTSQQGMILDYDALIYVDNNFFDYSIAKRNKYLEGTGYKTYPTPFGALLYSETSRTGIAVAFDVKNPKWDFAVINEENLKTWLQTQPGGFSIGEDGLLYHNGIVWSAVKPADISHGWEYRGKLASGHSVWNGGGRERSPGEFLVTDSKGNTELKITIPWMVQPGENASEEKKEYQYDYGLGPWGELYCLLPPDFKITGSSKNGEGGYMPIFGPDPNGTAELVVVRNHLKYFGRLNDDKVRLRKEANTTSAIVGTYPVKTGFRILEKGTAEETIGGQKNVWYKVRLLDGTEGWFFGAFVHNLYDGPDGNPPPWPNVADW